MCSSIWIGLWHRLAQEIDLGGGSVQFSILESAMEGAAAQMAVPILGIIAAAAVTFYTVSFMELRDKSFEELDDKYSELDESGGRQRRSRRRAERDRKKRN
ncbi:hypothetical protein U9M48_034139 [Paspalum notatum var. saurae]|uniref:Uncharacterized protein n=1 Tax=Paspalum notatum var. saurae TaxID=547442 RepID=A0AAQ3U953_PASNO